MGLRDDIPPPQLRLFDPPAPDGIPPGHADGLSPRMTLREFFEAHVVPHCRADARPLGLAATRESLALWESYAGDPPLADLEGDDAAPAAFLRGLRARRWRGRSLAPNTVRKHVIQIEAILKIAGPRDRRHNPHGADLIVDPPPFDPPDVETPDVDDAYSLEEIGQLLEACRHARQPLRPSVAAGWPPPGAESPRAGAVRWTPPEWWRALLVFAYNTGLRRETLLAARRSWIVEESTGRWLFVPRENLKGRKPKRFYCNRGAWSALEPLGILSGGAAGDDRPIFAWPYSTSHFARALREIVAASDLPRDRRFGMHGLRKALATELAAISSLAASMQLGHALGSRGGVHSPVTQHHYTHRRAWAAALERVPQPTFSAATDPQMRLF